MWYLAPLLTIPLALGGAGYVIGRAAAWCARKWSNAPERATRRAVWSACCLYVVAGLAQILAVLTSRASAFSLDYLLLGLAFAALNTWTTVRGARTGMGDWAA